MARIGASPSGSLYSCALDHISAGCPGRDGLCHLVVANRMGGEPACSSHRTTTYPLILAARYTLKQGVGLLLVIPICALAPLGFFALPGDPSFAKGLTAASRLGYRSWDASASGYLLSAWPFGRSFSFP